MNKMKALLIALLLVVTAGCGGDQLIDIDIDQDQNQNPPGNDGTIGGGLGSGLVSDFDCDRNETSPGEASNCTATWDGDPGPFTIIATRVGDSVTDIFVQSTPGVTIDPGPGGDGGGNWNLRLVRNDDQSVTLATTTVTLET